VQKAGQLSVTVTGTGLLEQNAGQSSVAVASGGDEEAAGELSTSVLEEAPPLVAMLEDAGVVLSRPPDSLAGNAHGASVESTPLEHPAPPDGGAAALGPTNNAMLNAANSRPHAAASTRLLRCPSRASFKASPNDYSRCDRRPGITCNARTRRSAT
jgi:hypothetical protein